jgi:hypothetical protein
MGARATRGTAADGQHASVRTCPGCKGPISRRAKLCAECRRRANSVGEKVWTESALPRIPARPRTPNQSQVYHGKCASLAQLQKLDMLEVKHRTLALASKMFDRELKSSTELTEIEMELLLEALDEKLFALGYVTAYAQPAS